MNDVIIIGAGGGGPVIAKELAEAGLEVLVLEAGPWLDPDRDFSRQQDDMGGLIDGRLRWGPGDRSLAPWMRRRDGVGFILQVAGVGGTTLHFNGIAPRAYPAAFGTDWPIRFEDLIPFYEQVEGFLPVSLVRDLATKDAVFAEGCEAIGLERSETMHVSEPMWRPCHNAILPIADMGSGTTAQADGCTMCGHCLIGCANPESQPLERKAKRATNVSYVPAAVATGRCRIIPDAFATALLFEEGSERLKRVRGVRWRDTSSGEHHEAEARIVVLAAGSIESPRLWLNSGLPDAGGVGRYLTTHFQDFVTGFFERDIHPDVGQVTMARADFPGDGTMWVQGFGPAAFAQVLTLGDSTWDEAEPPFDLVGRGWGARAIDRIQRYDRSLTVAISTDDEAVVSNGVRLDPEWPEDEHGKVPLVTYHPTPETRARRDRLSVKAAEILRAAGATEIHRSNVGSALFTHIMGTMRMGSDPATSVCDADGQSHLVEGLFVGDSSILSNGLGGPNPTLTAQAVAARTASRIAALA